MSAKVGVTRVDRLTDAERARFDEWADKWIEIGLRTGPADREAFERAVQDCYRFAGIPWPGTVIWVPSPLVLALAAPVAALTIQLVSTKSRTASRHRRTSQKVSFSQVTVDGAVRSAVHNAVDGAVGDAVGSAIHNAVGSAVDDAVHGAVGDAVGDAVGNVIRNAVRDTIQRTWTNYLGGQFWVGSGRYWGGAWTSFFREVCHLELLGDLWARGKAYEHALESACWWWPHRDFIMVCERPLIIHRELVDPAHPRGWGSHRLHCNDGPAIVWPDGWGVWAIHGVRVSQRVVETPATLTPAEILAEPNAEVRRVMLARFGEERFVRESGALPVHCDGFGDLYQVDVPGDEPLVMIRVLNSTPEPDGTAKSYWLRTDPQLRPLPPGDWSEDRQREFLVRQKPQTFTARNAVASLSGLRGEAYAPVQET